MNNYDDIINCKRPTSHHHPSLSKDARAAQFAPYAALVGHKELISSDEADYLQQVDPEHIVIPEIDN